MMVIPSEDAFLGREEPLERRAGTGGGGTYAEEETDEEAEEGRPASCRGLGATGGAMDESIRGADGDEDWTRG